MRITISNTRSECDFLTVLELGDLAAVFVVVLTAVDFLTVVFFFGVALEEVLVFALVEVFFLFIIKTLYAKFYKLATTN